MIKKKIVVAMSGGVDSSVAAALLKQQGHDVIGITMQIWPRSKKEDGCCALSAVEDARRVASVLDIPYYVLNFEKAFKSSVINDFISEYDKGRTPNPCVRCNRFIKFNALLKKAEDLGAELMATGHYARVEKTGSKYILKKGIDPAKDQSYFLYTLGQEALSKIIFPLGGLTKKEVRKLAKKFKLQVAEKEESQEICFIEGSIGDLFKLEPGDIVDTDGKVIGKHNGYQLYTIGQRRGLGLSRENPAYVVNINAKNSTITAGNRGDVYGDELTVADLNWISEDRIDLPKIVTAKIRYNTKGAEAEILPLSQGKIKVMFRVPQFAITPGQSAVFYDGDKVLGGGIIESRD